MKMIFCAFLLLLLVPAGVISGEQISVQSRIEDGWLVVQANIASPPSPFQWMAFSYKYEGPPLKDLRLYTKEEDLTVFRPEIERWNGYILRWSEAEANGRQFMFLAFYSRRPLLELLFRMAPARGPQFLTIVSFFQETGEEWMRTRLKFEDGVLVAPTTGVESKNKRTGTWAGIKTR